MSKKGQDRPLDRAALQELIERSPGPVLRYARDYPAGWDTGLHRHRRAQLVFAVRGIMTVTTESGLWVVPPQRAVWVPAEAEHALKMHDLVQLRTLYIDPARARDLPRRPHVVAVTPLLREVILRLMSLPPEATAQGAGARLVAVMLDELLARPEAPLHLPEPMDPRLRRICAALRQDPTDQRSLAEWADLVGASPRTLARRFQEQTGMGFAAWRQQARLLAALPLLAEGRPVTSVAFDIGYEGPSAFIAAFKRSFGVTPGRYLTKSEGTGSSSE